jgi:hypothetical protein
MGAELLVCSKLLTMEELLTWARMMSGDVTVTSERAVRLPGRAQ